MYSWQLEKLAGRQAIITRTAQGYHLQQLSGKRIGLYIGATSEKALATIEMIAKIEGVE